MYALKRKVDTLTQSVLQLPAPDIVPSSRDSFITFEEEADQLSEIRSVERRDFKPQENLPYFPFSSRKP